MSNSYQTEVQHLVSSFVDQLGDLYKRSIIESIGGNGARLNGTNGHRAKGDKRAPEEMDALADKFVAFVHKNPGYRIEQINKELGTTTKDLALPIRKLIAEGSVKTKGTRRATSYSAPDSKRKKS